jgi:hypothetical protein
MPREKPCYRDMMEELNKHFPEKQFLTVSEVAKFVGTSSRTVERHYGQYKIKPFGISKVQLAHLLCV